MITAEHVTAAIVRACKATGESVEDVRGKATRSRARHYALHALLKCFPITGGDAATLCGAPSEPKHYYGNSYQQVFRLREDGSTARVAKWFDDTIFDDVVACVQAVPHDPNGVAVAQEKDPRGGVRKRTRKPKAAKPIVTATVACTAQPATREAIGELAKAASAAFTIDLSKREKPQPKPPRIELIDTVPRHLIGQIEKRAPDYERVAYTPKGQITPRKRMSKADMYAELQAAVLNTPGARRKCQD